MSTRQRRPGCHTRNLCLGALLLWMLAACAAYADPSDSAVTRADEADADFALQGEFVGSVLTDPSNPQPVAMQIRAGGDGTFEAAQHLGGLPGSRSYRDEPVRLNGNRSNDFGVLWGGPWVVLVHPDHCVLVDPEGNRVGRLERVERQSPTMGTPPPDGAIVLFDGSGTDQFDHGRITEDGLLMEGADAKPMFQDFNLHLEFMLPYMPAARGQGRANSGIYLQSRYEVQVLDSFAIEPGNNGCGGLYKFRQPDVNMCLPPLTWQTYDVVFTAPRWKADGTKRKNARISVWHNGVRIHKNVELTNKTGAGKPEEPTLLPIRFQNHGDPVRFRNIWVVDRGDTPPARFPVRAKAKGKKQS